MARQKYEGIVEAVHYNEKGRIDWVRAFLRIGPTFSDRILLTRQELIDQLKSGKRFVIGKRVAYLGTTFETSHSVEAIDRDGEFILVTGEDTAEEDYLEDVPVV